MDEESSNQGGIKSFDNVYTTNGSLKYKHCYLRFAVESEIIEETHAMFETQMKEFIKKNKGKILHINKYKDEEIRCYFAVNLKEFEIWKDYVRELIADYIKPSSLPSFVEIN